MYAERLTFPHFRSAMEHIDTIIIPVGSLEAHGKHCPLGTDILIPERLCADLESKIGDEILIAPAINYGYTPLLSAFDGTVSLEAELLIDLYSEVARGFVKWGAKNIVFMNGHGGNIPMLTVACDRVAKAGARAMAISWWATYSQDILTICSSQGHAGEDETSVVYAIDASLIDEQSRTKHLQKAFILPLASPDQVQIRYPDAMNGDALRASKEKGEALLDLMCERNVDYIHRLRTGNLTIPIEII
ncbi:MAG: creatininase family protein [Rectinema sp.]|nr:creatininase family protein [Rectinema sp.]